LYLFLGDLPISEDPLEGGRQRRIQVYAGRDVSFSGNVEIPQGVFGTEGSIPEG
jgi:hypothetical protein